MSTIGSEMGPWDPQALAQLKAWDPTWTEIATKLTAEPWSNGILPRKFVELVCVALNAACTTRDGEATRRHVRAALDAGATRDEILTTFKMAFVLAIHSCSLGAPMLIEEAAVAGARSNRPPASPDATLSTQAMKKAGLWNTAWDPFVALDPIWTDQFMATGAGIYTSGVFTPKEAELLSIALDANVTHMYAPGTLRHIKMALKAGATVDEIMEVLKLCVVNGVQACNLGVPILAEELAKTKVVAD